MKKEDQLITRLIQSLFGISKEDSSYKSIYDYISKFIRDNSMLYIPKPKEIEAKVNALAEKLEINTQFEKSKLLLDYVSRLKMIFEKKSPIQNEFLFNAINLVIQLSHSPLINTRNIDMMRELFENRYIRNEYNKIVKSKYIPEDFEVIKTVYFDKIDYDEKTESESSENEEEEEEKKEIKNDIAADNSLNKENSKEMIDIEDSKSIIQSILIKPKADTLQSLFNSYRKLFVRQSYFVKMPPVFFDHLMKMNQREHYLNAQLNAPIDSDYVLNRILHLMSLSDDAISNANANTASIFVDRFNTLNIVDMSKELLHNVLLKFKDQKANISLLRSIRQIFQRSNIDSILIAKLSSLILSFINIHDIIVDRLMKVIYYQKGKIENLKEIYSKVLFIDPSIALIKEDSKLIFLNTLIARANNFISSLITNKSKLTILKALNFYYKHFEPICSYFIVLIEEIISTRESLVSMNKYTTSLLIKDLLDKMYSLCRNNQKLNMEIFICLIEVYTKFINEFIINGNLIDLHNEFFIDHLYTKGENKKFIFCFNKKYQIFDWVECFKIKHSSINNYEGPCVPLVLMNNQLYFKLLETGKTTFLLKNLKVTSYIDNLNKGLLFKEKMDYTKFFHVNQVDGMDNNSFAIESNDKANAKCDDNELNAEFDELRRLYETLRVSKSKIEMSFKEAPIFGEDKMISHSRSENTIVDFDFKIRNIDLNEDIEMEDATSSALLLNNNNTNNIKEEQKNNEEDNDVLISKRVIARENDQEMKDIYDMIFIKSNSKPIQEKIQKKNNSMLYNIDMILSHLFFNHILFINKEINTKFLEILNDNLHIQEHFNLMLHLFLFKAGFSMNKFILELNAFIFNQAKQVNKISIDHNYYLKNMLIELSSNLGSDLKPYRDKIEDNLQVAFKEEGDLLFHSNADLIFMDYQPGLPISIFFDKSIIAYYNAVFNYIVKIKRTLILIRDISLDKQIKSYIGMILQQKSIIKNFIYYRMIILSFASNLEFFVFNFVVNNFIEKFIQKANSLSSIDQYINSHSRFIKSIYVFLGLNNAALMKKMYKILNLIVSFQPFLNRFLLVNDFDDKAIEEVYMEVINSIEKFKRKEKKINEELDLIKEKIFLQ